MWRYRHLRGTTVTMEILALMRFWRLLLKTFVVCAALFAFSCTGGPSLHHDGIYFFKEASAESTLYLRFYSDGTVLLAASPSTPTQVAQWFHRGARGISTGNYVIRGKRIKFTTFGFESRADCAGTIEERAVVL